MTLSSTTVWMVIVVLAAGTFALRFSFLGMIGGRQIPGWALRLLRYTPVAVIPGLMAPQIARPMAEKSSIRSSRLRKGELSSRETGVCRRSQPSNKAEPQRAPAPTIARASDR